MWTIKPPPHLLRFLAFILLTSHLTLGQPHRPPPRPPRLIPFNNHGGHNFNMQEDSSSSEEESDSSSSSSAAIQEDHYPQSYPNIGYRSKVPIGASHSPHHHHQVSNPFTLPPAKHLHQQHPHQHHFPQMTETTPATLEEIEASYGDSLLHLKTQHQGKPFNPQSFNSQHEFSSPGFFDQIMDHHHYVPPHQLVSHQLSYPPLGGAPLKAPFRPSAPFTPNFESTSGFKPSFGPPVKGALGNPTFPLGTTGLRPGHVLEAPQPQHGPLSATYIPSSRPNLYKDLALTYPPLVVGGGQGPLFPFDSSQLSVESKKSSQSVSLSKPSHNPPSQQPPPSLPPVKDEYKVIFVKPPPSPTHSPYRAAPPIVLKQSQGPLSLKQPTKNNIKPREYYPTQDVSSSQDSPLKPEEQAVLYHLFSKTSSKTTTTVATPPSTATTTNVYLAEDPQSASISLPDYSFGDILKVSASSSPLKPKKKKKKSKDMAAVYSISHPYIIPLKSPKIGNEPDVSHRRWNRKNRLIPVDEDSGFMLTYAPTYSPVSSASTTIPTFVDYTQHGNEVEELLKAYGVQPGGPKESKGGLSDNGPTSIEDPPTFYTSTSTTTTSGTTTTTSTTPSPFKRIRVKPPTEPSTTTSTTTTTTEPPTTVRSRGTTGGPTTTSSPEGPSASRGGLRNNQISKKLDEDEEISDEYEEEESRYAPRESGVSKSSSSKSSKSSSSSSDSSVPESDEDYEGGEDSSESSEEYADSEEEEQPVKSKKKSSKEVDERPKTLDERKRKNVREEKEEKSSEEDEEENIREAKRSKTSSGRIREPPTVPTLYEPKKTSKRGRRPSESENSKEETTIEPPQEPRRHKETLKKEKKPSTARATEATATSRTTLKPKSKRNKAKDSSEEEEEEEVKTSLTTHQPRIGKKQSIGLILENIRNSTKSAESTVSKKDSEYGKTSKSKRQRIKPSVAKRLQKSGSKKIRKVRRKNKRKKSRAS